MEPQVKKVVKPSFEFVAVDFARSGVTQFPSTPEKAQEIWSDFLNQKLQEGLEFVNVFQYALGADTTRKMIIFKKAV